MACTELPATEARMTVASIDTFFIFISLFMFKQKVTANHHYAPYLINGTLIQLIKTLPAQANIFVKCVNALELRKAVFLRFYPKPNRRAGITTRNSALLPSIIS
jgi:hypothetical protein